MQIACNVAREGRTQCLANSQAVADLEMGKVPSSVWLGQKQVAHCYHAAVATDLYSTSDTIFLSYTLPFLPSLSHLCWERVWNRITGWLSHLNPLLLMCNAPTNHLYLSPSPSSVSFLQHLSLHYLYLFILLLPASQVVLGAPWQELVSAAFCKDTNDLSLSLSCPLARFNNPGHVYQSTANELK